MRYVSLSPFYRLENKDIVNTKSFAQSHTGNIRTRIQNQEVWPKVHLFMILTCSQCSIHPIILKNDKTYFSEKNRNKKTCLQVPTRKILAVLDWFIFILTFSCPTEDVLLLWKVSTFTCASSPVSSHLFWNTALFYSSSFSEICNWSLFAHFFPEALESSQHTHFLTSPLTTYLIHCPNSSPPSSQSHLYIYFKTLVPQLSFIRIPSTSKSAR